MNVDTGELRRLFGNEDAPEGFTKVPDKQRKLAEALLGSNDSVFVPKDNPLRKAMNKRRKKMAKQSRNLNRRNK